MREIKFRFLMENGEITDPYYLIELIDSDSYINIECEYSSKIKQELQYTGLKDKNGVEIYEGDFIKVLGDKCTVFWQQGAFKFQNISNYNIQPLFDFATINKCVAYEVIGNIYENQEMLELE